MTKTRHISSSILRLTVSLLLLVMGMGSTRAQVTKMFTLEKDSVPLFCGFSVSFDLVGPAMLLLSDHGEYEGALRVNLHDQWFPVFELGLGHRYGLEHSKEEASVQPHLCRFPLCLHEL